MASDSASRLRALDAEMTRGPWHPHGRYIKEWPEGWKGLRAGTGFIATTSDDVDTRGICYLRNHAAALAEVVEAARGALGPCEQPEPRPRSDDAYAMIDMVACGRCPRCRLRAALDRLGAPDGK